MVVFIPILPNQFKSTAGLKALKLPANGRYLMCKSLPYNFPLLYRSNIYPSAGHE